MNRVSERLAAPRPDLAGFNGLVIGLGVSGLAAAGMLRALGARAHGYDANPARVAELKPEWDARGERLRNGELCPMPEIDFCVVSPGVVSMQGGFFAWARENGVPVIGELELACRFIERPILAVTGTNGKTTVVNMIHHILRSAGARSDLASSDLAASDLTASDLVGNVGAAVSDLVRDGKHSGSAPVVMEISSFQCETMERFHPAVAAITNLAPDHLDRYRDVNEYYETKFYLARRLSANEAFWMGPGVEAYCPNWVEGWKLGFSCDQIGLRGLCFHTDKLLFQNGVEEELLPCPVLHSFLPQQKENALAAIGVCKSVGVPLADSLRALETFLFLPHRLEFIGEVNGARCYNDSKATNIHALCAALKSIPGPIRLIAGGRGKREPLRPAESLIQEKVAAAYLIGEDAPLFGRAWGDLVPVVYETSLENAVNRALDEARPGDTLLLSPACASWDMFRNYAERGDRFRQAVEARR